MMLTLGTLAANIETDRSWYLAGEAMKVSVTTDNALIAYAELCDTYSLVAGAVIGLAEGKGTETIELPSNMHSGYYVLSVYTRDNANVSRKLVAVVNPLRSSADDDIEWVQITDSDSLSYSATIAGESLTAAAMTDEKDVDVRETEGHIIKARVTNAYRGVTYKSHQIHPSLGIVGKQVHYFEGKMVNDTTAVFYTYGLHGKQPLVLSAATYTGVSLPIEMISPFASLLPKQLPHLVFHYRRSEVEARSMEMQRHQIAIAPAKRELQLGYYENAAAEEGVPMDYDNTLFGEHPDLTYNLDEYRQFLTVREVLLEYISCVQRTKVDGVP